MSDSEVVQIVEPPIEDSKDNVKIQQKRGVAEIQNLIEKVKLEKSEKENLSEEIQIVINTIQDEFSLELSLFLDGFRSYSQVLLPFVKYLSIKCKNIIFKGFLGNIYVLHEKSKSFESFTDANINLVANMLLAFVNDRLYLLNSSHLNNYENIVAHVKSVTLFLSVLQKHFCTVQKCNSLFLALKDHLLKQDKDTTDITLKQGIIYFSDYNGIIGKNKNGKTFIMPVHRKLPDHINKDLVCPHKFPHIKKTLIINILKM